MGINILSSASKPTFDLIKNFESKIGFDLSLSFKNFLVEYNPIYIKETYFKKRDVEFYLDRFYPFADNMELSLQSSYENLKEYFQDFYLPIGCDVGDWQIVMALQNENQGRIYLCRMDDILPNSLTLIANSFNEFIDALKMEDENEE